MKRKLTVLLLALSLTGCSIAQPEADVPDRFAGFYVVFDADRSSWSDNPALTEYGARTASTQYGAFTIPNQVLFAQEQDNQYIFPGLEGYSLFLVNRTGSDGSIYTECVSNMSPSSEGFQKSVTDEGTSDRISGVIYAGEQQNEAHSHFTAYRVFQTPDGRIYLDGSGNGFGTGGGAAYWETQNYTTTKNGESSTDTIEVKVTVEYAPRLEYLTVSQFDAENTILSSEDIALRDDLPEIRCLPETEWVLIEEQSADGTVRTAYNAHGDEPVDHAVVLLNDAGLGHTAYLQIN